MAVENSRLVSDLRRALDGLKTAHEQVVRGGALRAVGTLASGVSHHLNNILAVILGRLHLLLEKVHDPDLRRSLEAMQRSAREGAEVVRRVQAFSRAQRVGAPVPVDLNRLAEEILVLAQPRWQIQAESQGIQIEASLEAGRIPLVMGDPTSLQEALLSLLLNAVDALPEGGRITVRTWASDQGVFCAVSDTGIGMSEEARRQALDPFFTTKGPKAAGLGLSVTHGIIRQHGGDLAIESAEGQGTTVTIRLPLPHPDGPAALQG